MHKTSKSLFLAIIMVAIFFGCKKETSVDINPDITSDHGVFIVNEGNFQWSNASVTYYNFNDGKYAENVFVDVNSRPLGDVAQSICVLGEKAYIVVNNSNKIEIVNRKDFLSIGVINGFTSPRYLLPINSAKAYVSDLYSNSIAIVDLNTNSITGNIKCNGSSEEMVLVNTTVVVTNTRTDYIYLINSTSDAIVDSIILGFASNSVAEDKNGKLWVMCAGDAANSINASIHRVDIQSKIIEQSFPLPVALNIWDKLRINQTKDTLYYMCNGVFQMPINASALPSQAFIAQGVHVFHSLGINPLNHQIFVADAVDYVQKGKVYYYSSASGALLGTINTGVIPTDFYFY
ncbi:MAG: DUF5074 domain-containing protein [Bacteroidota bacterium]